MHEIFLKIITCDYSVLDYAKDCELFLEVDDSLLII